MKWKRIISGVLAAGMLLAAPVQLLASAESADAAQTPNVWESLLTMDDIDEENTFYYNKNGLSFEKLTHPEKDVKTTDGIVDYLGDSAVGVVTDPADESYNVGDRGQNYAWSAIGYGDWLYVGTCYAAMGNTLSLMKSSLGDKYDEKVLQATFDAMFNGSFFNTEEDGGNAKGVLVKINTKTGETKLLMAKSFNGYAPLFRNAVEYHGKLYFCGSVVGANGGLPSVWQVDPVTDECKAVYTGLSTLQDYLAAYRQGISTGIRGMCVYHDQLVISNVTMDSTTGESSATLLISSDPEKRALPRSRIPVPCSTTRPTATRTASTAAASGIWPSTTTACMFPSARAQKTICRTATPCSPLRWCAATRMPTAPLPGRQWPVIRKRMVPTTPLASTRSAPAPAQRT